jgi:hypothetical protein
MPTNILVNLGSGESGSGRVPAFFRTWREIRVDVDPSRRPDIVASMTDLRAIGPGSVHAVWASHCIEHLYLHEAPLCFGEIRRILSNRGFFCLRVPDLQTVARYIAEDRLHEVLYQSSAGPVTAHDVVFGFGREISQGRLAMAHHSGYTPTLLSQTLAAGGFRSYFVRRTNALELVAVARKGNWSDDREAVELLDALGL